MAEKKRIEIVLETVEPLMIKADKTYLEKIVENLLLNAIKFSFEGKKIFVKLIQLNETVEFSVKDEGQGISEEDHVKLFQRFQRLSARPTGGESSTGLGLFIVKTIADKMRAEVLCESNMGSGASIILRLPKKFVIS